MEAIQEALPHFAEPRAERRTIDQLHGWLTKLDILSLSGLSLARIGATMPAEKLKGAPSH